MDEHVRDELQATVDAMVQPRKGILAADESNPTIARRFESIGVESTEANRRAWRNLLLGTKDLGDYISAIILYEETLSQTADDGRALPTVAGAARIVPGIKVDEGKIPLANAPGDEITQGLDGLAKRLKGYRSQGARFAKWRAVYNVSATLPGSLAIDANADSLARYAAICQQEGIVPIVEPEVLMDGDHTIDRCAEVTEDVLHAVFDALHRHRAALEYLLLKPSMVVPGKSHPHQATPTEIATRTTVVLRRTVPAAVPGIFFLSGGQSPEEATANLDAMNRLGAQPWPLSFSYGRALQETALKAWRGQPAQAGAAQEALFLRAKLNGAAREGEYEAAMESRAAR